MRYLSITTALLFCTFVHAQISVLSSHMPVVGDTIYAFRDTLPSGFSIGSAGANQMWNFSNLTPDVAATSYAIDKSSTPYASNYPNANLALTNDFNGYLFFRNTTPALKVEGFAANDPSLGVIAVNYNPVPDQHQFPANYLKNFSGNYGFVETRNYNDLPPDIQQQISDGLSACPNPNANVRQLRVTFTSEYTDTIDAWGNVKTPLGTYESLRRKRLERTRTLIEVDVNCIFALAYSWIAISDTRDTTIQHSWLTTITKLPVVSPGYSQGAITSVTYSAIPPPPNAGFTWGNPAGGTVNFTSASENSPETYEWDFGDGNNSNLPNPSHEYTATGDYNVCLTVTNMSGNDTYCEQVSVTLAAGTVTVSGAILSEDIEEVRTVTINATETASPQTIVTGLDGKFSLTFNAGDDAVVTPTKTNDTMTNNGITTLDIIFIQRHILGTQLLGSPYKMISADVNNSNTITTLDIVLIRTVVLQINNSFPNGRLWAFTPADHVFANPQSPLPFPTSRTYSNLDSDSTDQNFIGMKLGDVNNSWDPAIAKTAAIGEVEFTMGEYDVLAESEITIPVKVKNFDRIAGYQFTLAWNPDVIEFTDVSNKTLSAHFGTHKTSEGFLTVSWNDEMGEALSLDDESVVFELKFKTIGGTGSMSEIKIGSAMTASEAYNQNLDLLEVKSVNGMVKVGDISNVSNLRSQISHLSVQPNPFSHSTNIIFLLPKDEAVSITIYDLMGKIVRQIQATYAAGEHVIEWAADATDGNTHHNGVYYIRMDAESGSLTAKAILIK